MEKDGRERKRVQTQREKESVNKQRQRMMESDKYKGERDGCFP